MDRAFLEKFGLEKSQIDQILDQASKDIGAKVNEISTLQSKYDQKIEELKTANSTIDTLKKSNANNEDLVKEVERYKAQVKEQEVKFKETLIRNTAVMELQKAGAINPDLAVHLIDLGLGNVDKDGKVIGISEQVEKIASDEAQRYLFNTTQKESKEQPQQTTETVERGGYNPQEGSTPKETGSWGYEAAKAQAEFIKANSSTDEFWANF